MMYQNKLAVAIKHNGKILREKTDFVQLPFGSEFTVLVKNLNTRRAKFTLHIDGTNVLDGTDIIVNANSEVELKRFIRNGNMDEGNAFKFIERTQAIEDGPRGIKVDDGIVRVEFWFEKEVPEVKTTVHHHYDKWHYTYPYRRDYWGGPYYGTYNSETYGTGDVYGATTASASLQNVKLGSAASSVRTGSVMRGMSAGITGSTASNVTAQNAAPEVSEAGITVPGSKVEQKFTTVYGFISETQSNVIVLRLVGKVGAIEVAAPVTVKAKQKCETCGKVNKHTSRFCAECGTALELV